MWAELFLDSKVLPGRYLLVGVGKWLFWLPKPNPQKEDQKTKRKDEKRKEICLARRFCLFGRGVTCGWPG